MTDRTISLISHPGSRGRESFERTFTLIDHATLTPLFEITRPREGDEEGRTTTEHWMRLPDGSVLVGGPIDEQLTDVETIQSSTGSVVHFDGEVPTDHSCHGPEFVFTDNSMMFTRQWRESPIVVVEHRGKRLGYWGQSVGEYGAHRVLSVSDSLLSIDSRSQKFDGLAYAPVNSERGRELLRESGEVLTVHDESVLDTRGFLELQLQREEKTLRSIVGDLRKVADTVDAFLGDTDSNPPSMYMGSKFSDLGRTTTQLHHLRLALAGLDED